MTRPRPLLALAVGGALLLVGCTPTFTPEQTPEPTMDPTLQQSLFDAASTAFQNSGMPGIAISVLSGDLRWDYVDGVADVEKQQPFSLDLNVRIASISKTFTADAVLQLVDQGLLSLDDVLESFLPGIPNGDAITIRQLLAMQSGIYDYTADEAFLAAFLADPTMPFSVQDVLDIVLAHEPDFAPGEQTAYCDTNYQLLGAIAEQVAGRPIHEIVNVDVVGAIGLASTAYPAPEDFLVPVPAATGYAPDGDALGSELHPVVGMNPAVAGPAGAMTSTVDDLLTWAQELAAGTLLSPELQAQRLETTTLIPGTDVGYGLGVMTIGPFIGHNGAVLGFSSFAMTNPETGLTVVVVGNASTNFTTPATDIAGALIKILEPGAL